MKDNSKSLLKLWVLVPMICLANLNSEALANPNAQLNPRYFVNYNPSYNPNGNTNAQVSPKYNVNYSPNYNPMAGNPNAQVSPRYSVNYNPMQ